MESRKENAFICYWSGFVWILLDYSNESLSDVHLPRNLNRINNHRISLISIQRQHVIIGYHSLEVSRWCTEDTNYRANHTEKPENFAQALTNICNILLSQFPQPCAKDDRIAISIPKEEYLAGVEACKHNLHGQIVWPKGSTPLKVAALKNKLSPLWKDLNKQGIMSLGKGFYEFSFSTLEEVRRVRSVASWNLQPGHLKSFEWTRNFNHNIQKNTNTQV